MNPQDVLKTLPHDADERKEAPVLSGVVDYFPLALVEVARLSKAGNDQHNPGQPLHWARGKSSDHGDCIVRHLMERGTFDSDGMRHTAKVAWRALAMLQEEIEAEEGFVPEVHRGEPTDEMRETYRRGREFELASMKMAEDREWAEHLTKLSTFIGGPFRPHEPLVLPNPGMDGGRPCGAPRKLATGETVYCEKPHAHTGMHVSHTAAGRRVFDW